MESTGHTPKSPHRAATSSYANLQSVGGSSQSITSQRSSTGLLRCIRGDHSCARELGEYRDITAHLAEFNLTESGSEAVMAPSPSMGAISEALAQLGHELPIEAGRPLSREGFQALLSLSDLKAISAEKFSALCIQNAEASAGTLALSDRSAASLQAAGIGGADRSNHNLFDPGQPSSSSLPNPPADTPVRDRRFSLFSNAATAVRRRGANTASVEMASAETGEGPAPVAQTSSPASMLAQIKQTRYWPQNKWAWIFLGCEAVQTLTAVEKGIQSVRRIMHPEAGEPIRLRVCQVLEIPTGAFAVIMFAYLMINKAALRERQAAAQPRDNPPPALDNV